MISVEIEYSDNVHFSKAILPFDKNAGDANADYAIQLLAPAFEMTEGSEKVAVGALGSSHKLNWNVKPTDTGKQTVLARFLCNGNPLECDQTTEIHIYKIDGLTANQIWVIATIFGFLAGAVGVVSTILALIL